MREFEWWCKVRPFEHREPYSEEEYQKKGTAYLGKKCCGQVMMLADKPDLTLTACPLMSCAAALHPNCRCWVCHGRFHGTERWRNHYLVGTMEEYLIHQPMEVKFLI